MKNLTKLKRLMMSKESGSYNEDFKKKFRNTGKKAMTELALLLDFNEFGVDFNPGGIAVSGDLRLMGMWSKGNGVYITMNKDFPGKPWGDVLFRHIDHMRDFTGGPNNYFKFKLLGDPEALRKLITSIRNDNGHDLIVKSLHDAVAECSCGRWSFCATGMLSREAIEEEFNWHRASLGFVPRMSEGTPDLKGA
jgi:hypothetical protein